MWEISFKMELKPIRMMLREKGIETYNGVKNAVKRDLMAINKKLKDTDAFK